MCASSVYTSFRPWYCFWIKNFFFFIPLYATVSSLSPTPTRIRPYALPSLMTPYFVPLFATATLLRLLFVAMILSLTLWAPVIGALLPNQ